MNIPLDEAIYFDCITTHPGTGAATDADSTPTFAVYEESTDTDIGVGGNLTKRTSLTGNYRGTFTLSAANGFEVGKWYSIIGSATVNSIAGKGVLKNFRVVAAEAVAGKPKADVDAFGGSAGTFSGGRPEVNTTHISGTAQTTGGDVPVLAAAIKAKTDALPADPADQSAVEASVSAATSPLATAAAVATLAGYVDTEVAAIKAKTDNLPAAPAATGDIPTAAQIVTALFTTADTVETGVAFQTFCRALLATMAGVATGGNTATIVFKNPAGGTTRVTMTVDADGNRSAVVLS